MTEIVNPSSELQRPPITEAELAALGELCLPENIGVDFEAVAAAHSELLPNPNSATSPSMFSSGDIPTNEGYAYRQVGAEALEDLAQSGIVRNGATARGETHPRWGHRVFWHAGQSGRAVNTGGRFVVEAPTEAVNAGWVTADKVSAIYTKTPEGEVKNIIARPEQSQPKQVPSFAEQVADTTRTNEIRYLPGQKASRGTHMGEEKTVPITEHEGLVALHSFLEKVVTAQEGSDNATNAAALLESLTFIGEKEFNEATAAIAEKWKAQLDADPQLQIWAVTSAIDPNKVKSDTFVLDEILKHFTDEELETYKERLVLSPDKLQPDNEDVEVVLLDDWISTGMQLGTAAEAIIKSHPDYADKIHIQLIAASQYRLEVGIATTNPNGAGVLVVPIESYYVANPADDADHGHITGAHSAVDFGFERTIASMVDAYRKIDGMEEETMPPLTNIARPYRMIRYYPKNVNRLRRAIKPAVR